MARNRITARASITIAPSSDGWTNKDTALLCINIKDGSTIEAQSVYPRDFLVIVAVRQLASNINKLTGEIVTDALG